MKTYEVPGYFILLSKGNRHYLDHVRGKTPDLEMVQANYPGCLVRSGESADDAIQFLQDAWSGIHLPEMLFTDKAPWASSQIFQDFCRNLGVELPDSPLVAVEMRRLERLIGRIEKKDLWLRVMRSGVGPDGAIIHSRLRAG
jgi:hypothetical protein